MARSKAQLDNLKKGKATQFKTGDKTAKEAGKKGGKASGEAKRRNKTIYQMVQMVADAPISDSKTRDVVASIGIDDENLVNDAVVVAGIYNAAVQGNVAAVEKWEEMKERAATEGNDSAHEHALAIMRANFWKNVSSNFGQFNVCAIKHRYRHYEAKGGRGSTKSSDISLVVVRLVMEHEGVHALVMRKVGNTIADSVFTQYQWAIAQLGVAEYWKTRNSPPTLTYKPTGQALWLYRDYSFRGKGSVRWP